MNQNDPTSTSPLAQSLSPRARALAIFGSWMLLLLAQPGWLHRDGLGFLVPFAPIPWVWAASRPGPWAKRIEWAGATFGLCGYAFWMRYLLDWAVFPMGAVPAVYLVLAGLTLRRLGRRFPLALAAPMAWVAFEAIRFTLGAPFSFGWWRVGSLMHDFPLLNQGARVFGVWGLSFAVLAWAGWVVDRLRARATATDSRPGQSVWSHAVGIGAPLSLLVAGLVVPAPETTEGPRVMVVTPGIIQELKHNSGDLFHTRVVDPIQVASEGMAAVRDGDEPLPDLVAFGESMVAGSTVADSAIKVLRGGGNAPEFTGMVWTEPSFVKMARGPRETIDLLQGRLIPSEPMGEVYDESWIRDAQQGRPPIPEGTAFFGGVTRIVGRDGAIWRQNGAHIWNAQGEAGPFASKSFLVPAAEDPFPAAHWPWILGVIKRVGGYIPDFVTNGTADVLEFSDRAGQSHRVGVLVCYDNAFDAPFLDVHGGAGVDFHIVASNEAWYKKSVLMDHMLAFSRLAAIYGGRSVLRATNSGASALFGPDGALLGLLEEGGEHKMVRGTLRVNVPIPARSGGNPPWRTPYVRTWVWQAWAFWLLWGGLVFFARRK